MVPVLEKLSLKEQRPYNQIKKMQWMCPILGFECCLRSTLLGAVRSARGCLHRLPGAGGVVTFELSP